MTLWISICKLFFFADAYAHSEVDISNPWWASWNWSWTIVISLSLLTYLYVKGWRLQKKRFPDRAKQSRRGCIAFCLSLLFLIISLLSPLDTYSDYLGWVHMLQHTTMMMLAAPLMALSSFGYISQWSLLPWIWRRLWIIKNKFHWLPWGFWSRPISMTLAYGLTLWIWHLPKLYEAALHNVFIHDLQHISFFCAAYWFWKLALDPYTRNRIRPEVGVIYIFVTSLHSMILGVLMALSPVVWYESYNMTAIQMGFEPLVDQGLAGLIMWMPAGLAYLVTALLLFVKVLEASYVPKCY